MNDIRTLRADEIECRVGQCKKAKNGVGCSLLLYKDARCDMKLLDEVFGSMNWKREHSVIDGNLYCTISVWDGDKNQWISRQDVGTESNTEKEKGQASDSFKRAGVNWGIGRELYTAPFIWIPLKDGEYFQQGDKYRCTSPFFVSCIEYNENREISRLEIVDKSKNVRFRFGVPSKPDPNNQETTETEWNAEQIEKLKNYAKKLLVKLNAGDKTAAKEEFESLDRDKMFCDIKHAQQCVEVLKGKADQVNAQS